MLWPPVGVWALSDCKLDPGDPRNRADVEDILMYIQFL